MQNSAPNHSSSRPILLRKAEKEGSFEDFVGSLADKSKVKSTIEEIKEATGGAGACEPRGIADHKVD
jgi:hypothetical protein